MEDEYFKELNVDDIPSRSKLLLIGPASVKHENIIADLFENYNDEFVENSLIITPPNHVLKTIYPLVMIDDEYSSESIMANLHNGHHNAIVLYMHHYINDSAFTEMMLNGKHYNKDIVIVITHPMSMPPSIRYQFDYIFISHYDDVICHEKIHNMYVGAECFSAFYMFQTAYNGITSAGDVMVIHQPLNGKPLTKTVFWYSIPDVELPNNDVSSNDADNMDDYLTIYI